MTFLVGFETEFSLLNGDRPPSTGERPTPQMLQCGPRGSCIHEIAQNVMDAGIKLEKYYDKRTNSQVCLEFNPPTQEHSKFKGV